MENLQKSGLDGAGAGLGVDEHDANGVDDNSKSTDDKNAPDYGKKDYWEKRYAEDGDSDLHVDDWYLKFSDLEKYLVNVPRDDKPALDIGCGTSKLCEELITH